jgi:predicted nucleic acid-binding protein
MKYLVDTNVISEMSKPAPSKAVISWMKSIPETDLFMSVVSIGEIVFGICKLSDKTRSRKLTTWLDNVIYDGFEGRILEISIDVMRVWGELYASLPRSLPIQDTLIAATAIANNLAIATRNVKDFKDIAGLSIFNPWED